MACNRDIFTFYLYFYLYLILNPPYERGCVISVSDVDRYVIIINLLHFILGIYPTFVGKWEIQPPPHTHRTFILRGWLYSA
jgi:hypothetical protein